MLVIAREVGYIEFKMTAIRSSQVVFRVDTLNLGCPGEMFVGTKTIVDEN